MVKHKHTQKNRMGWDDNDNVVGLFFQFIVGQRSSDIICFVPPKRSNIEIVP